MILSGEIELLSKRKIFFVICVLFFSLFFLHKYFYVPKTYSNEYFGIENYVSENDEDGDGIDDQSDFLSSVRQYINTRPKYKSKYYARGYPDDGYGVCTDVVAFGMNGAGYDLRQLVDEDIKAHPEGYDVEVPDSNIDFRRVRNLKVWFDRYATPLSIDPNDYEQWQGGDIVIFNDHIGVVSDKRNKKGIPLLIHHYSPIQINYEEDCLESRNDIHGHYRSF